MCVSNFDFCDRNNDKLRFLHIKIEKQTLDYDVIQYFICGNIYAFFFPISAYQNNDITEFEKILKTNHSNIMDDPFIREHIEGMLLAA